MNENITVSCYMTYMWLGEKFYISKRRGSGGQCPRSVEVEPIEFKDSAQFQSSSLHKLAKNFI